MAAAGSGVQLQNSARCSFGGTAARRPKQRGDFLGEVVLISSADHHDHVRQHVGERTAQGAGPCMRRDVQPSVMMGLGTPRPRNEKPVDGVVETGGWEHVQGVSACKRATTAGRAQPTACKKFAAGVAEQAQREEHRPCDRVHLHAERSDRVSVPKLPWTATWLTK